MKHAQQTPGGLIDLEHNGEPYLGYLEFIDKHCALVEGAYPVGLYNSPTDAEDLLARFGAKYFSELLPGERRPFLDCVENLIKSRITARRKELEG